MHCLLCLLAILRSARPHDPGNIEQTFANSLTALPTENLAVSGAFYVPAYSSVSMSQGKLRVGFLGDPERAQRLRDAGRWC